MCPNKTTQDVKDLRETLKEESKNAEFLGEFPSLTAVKSTNTNIPTPGPYLMPVNQSKGEAEFCLTDTVETLYKAQKHVKEAYDF